MTSAQDEDDDLLIVMDAEPVDECHDGLGQRCVRRVQDPQRHAGIPARPPLLHLLSSPFACFAVLEHNGHGGHVRADR